MSVWRTVVLTRLFSTTCAWTRSLDFSLHKNMTAIEQRITRSDSRLIFKLIMSPNVALYFAKSLARHQQNQILTRKIRFHGSSRE